MKDVLPPGLYWRNHKGEPERTEVTDRTPFHLWPIKPHQIVRIDDMPLHLIPLDGVPWPRAT